MSCSDPHGRPPPERQVSLGPRGGAIPAAAGGGRRARAAGAHPSRAARLRRARRHLREDDRQRHHARVLDGPPGRPLPARGGGVRRRGRRDRRLPQVLAAQRPRPRGRPLHCRRPPRLRVQPVLAGADLRVGREPAPGHGRRRRPPRPPPRRHRRREVHSRRRGPSRRPRARPPRASRRQHPHGRAERLRLRVDRLGPVRRRDGNPRQEHRLRHDGRREEPDRRPARRASAAGPAAGLSATPAGGKRDGGRRHRARARVDDDALSRLGATGDVSDAGAWATRRGRRPRGRRPRPGGEAGGRRCGASRERAGAGGRHRRRRRAVSDRRARPRRRCHLRRFAPRRCPHPHRSARAQAPSHDLGPARRRRRRDLRPLRPPRPAHPATALGLRGERRQVRPLRQHAGNGPRLARAGRRTTGRPCQGRRPRRRDLVDA